MEVAPNPIEGVVFVAPKPKLNVPLEAGAPNPNPDDCDEDGAPNPKAGGAVDAGAVMSPPPDCIPKPPKLGAEEVVAMLPKPIVGAAEIDPKVGFVDAAPNAGGCVLVAEPKLNAGGAEVVAGAPKPKVEVVLKTSK